MLRLVKRVYFVFALLICMLIILKSIEYYSPNFEKGFLVGKTGIYPVYKLFLYSHIIPIKFYNAVYILYIWSWENELKQR